MDRKGAWAAALAALMLAGMGEARAQSSGRATTSPGEAPVSAFCAQAEGLYAQLMAQPSGHRKGLDAVNFNEYRNAAAQRIVTLAWAGQCKLGNFLALESQHMREVLATPPQPTQTSAMGAMGQPDEVQR